jgi:hypothetical protein
MAIGDTSAAFARRRPHRRGKAKRRFLCEATPVPVSAEVVVKILFFILLVILIAQVGFWHALGAVLGALVMIIVLAVLVIAVLAVGVIAFATGFRARW